MEPKKDNFKLIKAERARAKQVLDRLFDRNAPYLFSHGFRFTWLFLTTSQPANCQIVCIASKKKLKKAVDRNRRKRLLKELYRLNKENLNNFLVQTENYLALSINYVGKEDLEFGRFEPKFRSALDQLILELKKNTDSTLPVAD
jgi:ribonuclease P protein component